MSESGLPSLPPSEDSSFYLGKSPYIEHIPVWSGPCLLFDLPHISGPTLLHSSVTCSSCLSPLHFWLFFSGTFFSSSSCHSVSAERAHLQINRTISSHESSFPVHSSQSLPVPFTFLIFFTVFSIFWNFPVCLSNFCCCLLLSVKLHEELCPLGSLVYTSN